MDPKQTDHQPTIKSDQTLSPDLLKKDVKDHPTQNRIDQIIKSNMEITSKLTPTPNPTPTIPGTIPKVPEARRAPNRVNQITALRKVLENYCSDSQSQNKAFEAIIAIFPEDVA